MKNFFVNTLTLVVAGSILFGFHEAYNDWRYRGL